VSTDTLVEEAYKVDDFAGTVTLLIESQEEGLLTHILVPEGQQVPVGTPIAIINEEAGSASQQQQQQGKAASQSYTCPSSNVYDSQQPSVRVLEWQSYLKDSSKAPGSDCGCM
jgi:pyruvate/2-oxoglutarate dehydrogenase complex dihydrolipoamide acyltransferase (E2) component